MVVTIRLVPDPILHQKTLAVADARAADIHALIADMKDTCLAAKGAGLAANQIGRTERVCVINYDRNAPYALINPEIVFQSKGTSILEEGCLSVPDRTVPVSRHKKVRVRALDESGKPVEITADDFLAKVLQHEIDHLNGKLITDYLPSSRLSS